MQIKANLLAAEVFSDAPGVCDNAQSHFVSGLYNVVEVGKPKIKIKLGDCENNGGAAVVNHFLKIGLGMLYVV